MGSSVGEGFIKCEGLDMGDSLGVEFDIELGSSNGISAVYVDIKLDGSSVECDRFFRAAHIGRGCSGSVSGGSVQL